MNYYEHHIGDYLRDTAHLSLLEHGIYLRLIQVYYTRELPIPKESAARLIGARSPEELEALDIVLREFFILGDEGWRQGRCDEVIAAHHAFIEKQRANGRASAAKRSLNGGSTTGEPDPQPPLNDGSTVEQPPTSHFPLPNERGRLRGSRRVPADFSPDLTFALAEIPDLDAEREVAKFRDHEFQKPRKDWDGAWRNWIRTCRESGRYAKNHNGGNARGLPRLAVS